MHFAPLPFYSGSISEESHRIPTDLLLRLCVLEASKYTKYSFGSVACLAKKFLAKSMIIYFFKTAWIGN